MHLFSAPPPSRLRLSFIYATVSIVFMPKYSIVWRYHTLFTHSSVHGTFELFSLFGYYEHSCTSSCMDANFFNFLVYIPAIWYLCLEELPNCFPKKQHQFTFPSEKYKGSNLSTSMPIIVIAHLFYYSHPSRCKVIISL